MCQSHLRAAAIATLLVSSSAVARADLAPASDAFEIVPAISFPPQVDPSGGAGDLARSSPVVAAVREGFAVAWVEETLLSGEVETSTIRGRLVGGGGEPSEQFETPAPASAWPVERASCPSLAGLGDGSFLLGFSRGGEDHGRDVWLQRFGSRGALESGDEAPLASTAATLHDLPSVSASPAGRAAVAWQAVHAPSAGGLTSTYRALALGDDGAAGAVDLTLGTPWRQYRPERPAIAIDRAGRFTAAWMAPNPRGTKALWAQSFAPTGAPLAPAARIGTLAAGGVAVTRLGAGGVIAWARRSSAGTVLRADRIGADGRRIAGTVLLAAGVESFDSPVLAPVPGHGYLLAWLDGGRLRALHLGTDLAPRGATLEIAAASPELPGVAVHGVGAAVAGTRALVAWAGPLPDGLCPGNAILGRLLDVRP